MFSNFIFAHYDFHLIKAKQSSVVNKTVTFFDPPPNVATSTKKPRDLDLILPRFVVESPSKPEMEMTTINSSSRRPPAYGNNNSLAASNNNNDSLVNNNNIKKILVDEDPDEDEDDVFSSTNNDNDDSTPRKEILSQITRERIRHQLSILKPHDQVSRKNCSKTTTLF